MFLVGALSQLKLFYFIPSMQFLFNISTTLRVQKVMEYSSSVVISHGPETEEVEHGRKSRESEVWHTEVFILGLLLTCWDYRKLSGSSQKYQLGEQMAWAVSWFHS